MFLKLPSFTVPIPAAIQRYDITKASTAVNALAAATPATAGFAFATAGTPEASAPDLLTEVIQSAGLPPVHVSPEFARIYRAAAARMATDMIVVRTGSECWLYGIRFYHTTSLRDVQTAGFVIDDPASFV